MYNAYIYVNRKRASNNVREPSEVQWVPSLERNSVSDEGPSLETLDLALCMYSAVHHFFIFHIHLYHNTTYTQNTMFISLFQILNVYGVRELLWVLNETYLKLNRVSISLSRWSESLLHRCWWVGGFPLPPRLPPLPHHHSPHWIRCWCLFWNEMKGNYNLVFMTVIDNNRYIIKFF